MLLDYLVGNLITYYYPTENVNETVEIENLLIYNDKTPKRRKVDKKV